MEFFVSRTQKAKKKYRCYLTGIDINPGEKYIYITGYDEDFFYLRSSEIGYKIYNKLNDQINYRDILYFDETLSELVESLRNRDKFFLRNLGYARKLAEQPGIVPWFRKIIYEAQYNN